MQTFLPYPDYEKSASVLDRARLGKQRVENLQILKAIVMPEYGWKNHPAVKMWKDNYIALYEYHWAICKEWTDVRGYKDTCLRKMLNILGPYPLGSLELPQWLGDEDFHRSHQSNLIRKDSEFYAPLFPDVPDNLEYVWPTP